MLVRKGQMMLESKGQKQMIYFRYSADVCFIPIHWANYLKSPLTQQFEKGHVVPL
jgi:hypothetical protein